MSRLFGVFYTEGTLLDRRRGEALEAVAHGLRQRGEQVFVCCGYRRCDVAVTWGMPKSGSHRGRAVAEICDRHKGCGSLHLVVDAGYLRRERYVSLSWNEIGGRSSPVPRSMPSDRWENLKIPLATWRRDGDHVLVCGQVATDAAVAHVHYGAWLQEVLYRLINTTSRRIVFRPHPGARSPIRVPRDVVVSHERYIKHDLLGAWVAVTFNSTAGVEAVVRGIPVIAEDPGSMVYTICEHTLAGLEHPCMPDRRQWAADLAYRQWSLAEIAAGDPWTCMLAILGADERPLRAKELVNRCR